MKTTTFRSSRMADLAILRQNKIHKMLLTCGVLSSLVYVAATIIGGLVWEGYNPFNQAVSELSAYGAPSRPIVVTLFILFDILLILFALGVWKSAGSKRSLRITSALTDGYGIICLAAPFTSMNMPGAERTLSDTLHLIATAVGVVFIFLIIGFGMNAYDKKFRLYSIGTLAALFVFGGVSAWYSPQVAANTIANLPTPWFGLIERLLIFSFLQWIAGLALVLLGRQAGSATHDHQ